MDRLSKRGFAGKVAARHVAYSLALSACAGGPATGAHTDESRVSIGVAHFLLNVDPDALTSDVEYQITGNNVLRIKGVMEPVPGTTAIGVIVNLPTGSGYTIRIDTSVALGDAGRASKCSASAMFSVTETQATELPLTLQCDELEEAESNLRDAGESDASTRDAGGKGAADARSDSPTDAGALIVDAGEPGERLVDSGLPIRDAGAKGVAPETCEVCAQRECAKTQGIQRERDCYQANGTIIAGPATGDFRAAVCTALMDCAHETGCAASNPEACYCGQGVSAASCTRAGPIGDCRELYEAAGETTEPQKLLGAEREARYTLLNVVVPLLSCEASACGAACFPSRR